MCSTKPGGCDCDCKSDNALDEIHTIGEMRGNGRFHPSFLAKLEESMGKDPETVDVEEVVEINGVEYVRKNKKTLIEEPVIIEDDTKTLLTE